MIITDNTEPNTSFIGIIRTAIKAITKIIKIARVNPSNMLLPYIQPLGCLYQYLQK